MNEKDFSVSIEIENEQLNDSYKHSKISLWLGILSIFPYAFLFLLIFGGYQLYVSTKIDLFEYMSETVIKFMLYIPIFTGLPFGFIAIINGAISVIKRPRVKNFTIIALTGIVLGIIGILLNILYVGTCSFCE